MKKIIFPLILCCLLLALEILPFGAALHGSGDAHTVLYCSYFSIDPFMDGNFAPLIVAIASAVLLVLTVIYGLHATKQLKKVLFAISCVAMVLSFCPLFYCLECFSLVDSLISLILFIYTMIFVEKAK